MIRKFLKNMFVVPPDAGASPFVIKHFKRNFTANFLDIGTYFFGDSFLASYTILPVFVSTLTDSPIIIGLVPAFYEAGWFIPQLFFAPYIRRKAKLMPLVIKLGIMERFSYLFLAVGAFFLPRMNPELGLGLILVLIIWRSVTAGFYALPWQEVIAKVIPVSHRGRFYGWANMFGKFLGILGAAITGLILVKLPYPKNYSLVFFIGFIVVMLALTFFMLTKEPENPLDAAAKEQKMDWRKDIGRILSANPSFQKFPDQQGDVVPRLYGFQFHGGLRYRTVFPARLVFGSIYRGVNCVQLVRLRGLRPGGRPSWQPYGPAAQRCLPDPVDHHRIIVDLDGGHLFHVWHGGLIHRGGDDRRYEHGDGVWQSGRPPDLYRLVQNTDRASISAGTDHRRGNCRRGWLSGDVPHRAGVRYSGVPVLIIFCD